MDINELRNKLGLTQEEMARILDLSVSTVSKWEEGKNKPSQLARKQISRLERKLKREGKHAK